MFVLSVKWAKKSSSCNHLENYKDAWEDLYKTNWNNLSTKYWAENVGAMYEVMNANTSKTIRVLEKIYTEQSRMIGY